MIEGLGFAFQHTDIRRKAIGALVKILYKTSLKRARKVIFLNPDNQRTMIDRGIITAKKTTRINGIGVNLDQFSYETINLTPPPTFLCIARLLKEKGLREYANAARKVKKQFPDAVFQLLGPEDPSPDGIPFSEIKAWHTEGTIQYLGETNDVRPFLKNCHVYVLPSYHEGLPRTVIEAMAIGRPILTTTATGCKETVIENKNGFLVPVRNADALAERMIWFIEHRDQWEIMGRCSRQMAEEKFDVQKINKEIMTIMGLGE